MRVRVQGHAGFQLQITRFHMTVNLLNNMYIRSMKANSHQVSQSNKESWPIRKKSRACYFFYCVFDNGVSRAYLQFADEAVLSNLSS